MQDIQIVAVLIQLTLGLILLVVGPIFTIWSLNELWGFAIPLNMKTWVAMAWIMSVLYTFRITVNRS